MLCSSEWEIKKVANMEDHSQTLYGMNLFLYSPTSRSLIIAKNFWLYFATWLPLTALTVICYLLMKAYHKYRHPEDTLEAGLKAVKSL